jgi:Ca-activated chloride channel family protein
MNTNAFDPTDSLLTDYLLGEASPERMKEAEELLKSSAEAREELERLRATQSELTTLFAAELHGTSGLGKERESALHSARNRGRGLWRSPFALAAAAVLAICAAFGLHHLSQASSSVDGGAPGTSSSKGDVAEASDDGVNLSLGDAPGREAQEPADLEVELAEAATTANPVVAFIVGQPTQKNGWQVPALLGKADGTQDISNLRFEPTTGVTRAPETALPQASTESLSSITYLPASESTKQAEAPRPELKEALKILTDLTEKKSASREEERLLYRKAAETLRSNNIGATTEAYDPITENDFLSPTNAPLSTFSLDVDTASYANVRRFVDQGQSPPRNSVRIEELINYFSYSDPAPTEGSEHPVTISTEVSQCFWNPNHRIVRIGVKAKEIAFANRPANNLVFLIDVSGSMDQPDKLPLLKKAFRLLTNTLGENDRVAIVVYASATGLVLPSTNGEQKEQILTAIENLSAGGSTNGAGGIQLAYQTAIENFRAGGNNRVILATDGDFNVGISDRGALVDLIQEKARSGVFLSVLGFGQGNLKDSQMEQLADKGNGNYNYIDSEAEAEKVLVRELGGTLITVAKDVKIQAEFNPARVAAYRLIGYENRVLADKDFNDDTKDAGDLGSGHSICALYEVVPASAPSAPTVDELRYQTKRGLTGEAMAEELLTVKLRYKEPNGQTSKLLSATLLDKPKSFDEASENLRWASIVASYGMFLRGSAYRGNTSLPLLLELGVSAMGEDPHRDRKGFLTLVTKTAHMLLQ